MPALTNDHFASVKASKEHSGHLEVHASIEVKVMGTKTASANDYVVIRCTRIVAVLTNSAATRFAAPVGVLSHPST